jgi:RNA polymerase sigma-70 factor, ECF subfamily
MEPSEQELLALLAHDLRANFRHLVVRYQRRLYLFACRLSGSPQDAEDIVQEAFVGAYVSLENYPARRVLALRLQPWLYRVLLNVYNHHTRGARLRLISLEESSYLEVEDRVEERPEVLFEHQERRQELESLVAALPERYRVAVTCYYFEQLSYQEVAELLDQPLGTVKSAISRGVGQLRALASAAEHTQEGGEYRPWQMMKSSDAKA